MQHFQNGGNPIWLPKNRGTNLVNKDLVSVSSLLLNLSIRTDNKLTKYTNRLENKPKCFLFSLLGNKHMRCVNKQKEIFF